MEQDLKVTRGDFRLLRLLFLCSALIALFAAQVTAQELRGIIRGIVTDSSDAVVAGAKITLSNDNTGVDWRWSWKGFARACSGTYSSRPAAT